MNNKEKLIKIMSDPILWIETFVKIVDKQGRLVPFKAKSTAEIHHAEKGQV